MNPELIAAVRERIALGHTDEMIKEELIQTGYTADVVEAVLTEAYTATVASVVPVDKRELVGAGELFQLGWSFAQKYAVLGILLAIPFSIVEISRHLALISGSLETSRMLSMVGVLTIIAFVTQLFLVTTTFRVVAEDNGSQKVLVAAAWQWAKGRVLGLFWISLLTVFVVWGGLLLFIIPGLIMLLSVYFAQYVYVVEGQTGMNALLRSRELVKGQWWVIARRLSVIGFIFFAIMLGVGILAGIVTSLVGETGLESVLWSVVLVLGEQLLSGFMTLILLKIGMELYRSLASGKPATVAISGAGKGTYVALGLLGLLFPIIILGYFSTIASLSSFGTETVDFLSDEEAKVRAIKLRNIADFE